MFIGGLNSSYLQIRKTFFQKYNMGNENNYIGLHTSELFQ